MTRRDDPATASPSGLSHTTSMNQPRVGVGVIITRGKSVLMGLRSGSHGAGTWGFPGGNLEFAEDFAQCARREVLEETGLCVTSVLPGPVTNDHFVEDGKHYVTVFVHAQCAPGEPRRMEPQKCLEWAWIRWDRLPDNLFRPVRTLVASGYEPNPD